MLFSASERHYAGPKEYSEGRYEYTDRSAREDVARVRAVLEDWFSRYPLSHREEFRRRFASGDDTHYLSSTFELYLHELLLRLDYSVEVHPEVGGGESRRPDFRIARSGEIDAYVEAVLATDETPASRGADARINLVYDAIDRLDSPDFFLGMDIRGAPVTPPPGRKLCKALSRWLSSLNYGSVKAIANSGKLDDLPSFEFEHDGWQIAFQAIPKNDRTQPGTRPIGIQTFDIRKVESWTAIRGAIIAKASRYGTLNRPYIIAVNALSEFVGRIDILQALFGQEQLILRGRQAQPEMVRAPNGAWTAPGRPRYTRVSAVLLAEGLLPNTAASCPIRLYHNPWAQRPVSGAICRLPQCVIRESLITQIEGTSPATLFCLPPNWPRV